METFKLNNIEKIKKYSKLLNAKKILFNKTWKTLSEKRNNEVFVFKPNNELMIIQNESISYNSWEILSNKAILLNINKKNYLLNAVFVNPDILVLQLDNSEDCLILIESETKSSLSINTIDLVEASLNKYSEQFNGKYKCRKRFIRNTVITLIVIAIYLIFCTIMWRR